MKCGTNYVGGLVCADIFSIDNTTLLSIVDYYSKFPVMKKAYQQMTDSEQPKLCLKNLDDQRK